MLMVQIFFSHNVFMYMGKTGAHGENPQLQECLWARGSGQAGCHWATCSRTCAINVAGFSTTVFVLLVTGFSCQQSVWRRELQVFPRSWRKHQCCWQHFFAMGSSWSSTNILMWFLKIQDHLNWLFIWLRQHKYILNPCSGPGNWRHMRPSGSGKSSCIIGTWTSGTFCGITWKFQGQIFLLFWKNNQQFLLCSWNNSTPGCDGLRICPCVK